MARELEVKVLDIDKNDLEKKLVDIGASLIKREKQINRIYDYRDNSFEDVKKGYIRIRSTENLIDKTEDHEFTIKKVINSEKVREYEEIETKISDPHSLEKMLGEFDLYKKHEGYKERIRYAIDNIVYDIDTWDRETLPYPYLEIEVECDSDLDRALALIDVPRDKVSLKSIRELRQEVGLED